MTSDQSSRVSGLQRSFSEVSAAFSEAAGQLRKASADIEDGRLPDQALPEVLVDLTKCFAALRATLELDGGVMDLETLREAVEATAVLEAVGTRRAEVDAQLRALERLEHTTGQMGEQIGHIRATATRMRSDISGAQTGSDLEERIARATPFVALARLVSDSGLSDSEMMELEGDLGEDVPRIVAIAAMRGNLRVSTVETASAELMHSSGVRRDAIDESKNGGPPAPGADFELGNDALHNQQAARVVRDAKATSTDRIDDDARVVGALLDRFPPSADAPGVRTGPGGRARLGDVLETPGGESSHPTRPAGGDHLVAHVEAVASVDSASESTAVSTVKEVAGRPAPVNKATGSTVVDDELDVTEADRFEAANGPSSVNDLGMKAEPDAGMTPSAAVAESLDDVWRLVHDDRLSLAYHLARATKALGETPSIPDWLIGALAMGPRIRKPLTGAIAPRLASMLAESSDAVDALWESDATTPHALLASAATLLPAIIAPNTGVITIVQGSREQLKGRYPQLSELLHVIAAFCERGSPLDIRRWGTVHDVDTWSADRNEMQTETSEWLDRARHYKMSYQPASEVWNRWLRTDGILGPLVQRIIEGKPISRADADRTINLLHDPVEFGGLVDESFRNVLGKRWRGQQITGSARRSLERNAGEAVELIDRWVGLMEQRPDAPKSYEVLQAEKLREDLQNSIPSVLEELREVDSGSSEGSLATTYALASVDALQKLLEGAEGPGLREPNPDDLLNEEIPLCEVDIDSTGAPFEIGSPRRLATAIHAEAGARTDWKTAFARRLSVGDAVGSEVVLRRLQTDDEGIAEELAQRFETEVDGLKHQLEAKAGTVQESLEVALSLGLLGEAEHVDLVARVNDVMGGLSEEVPRFDRAQRELDAIEETIRVVQSERKDQIERHVRDQNVAPDSEAYRRIYTALRDNDFVTASEYLSAAVENSTLFDASLKRRDAFREFFIDDFDTISNVIRNQAQVLSKAVRRGSVPQGAVDMTNVPKPQAEEAADLLDEWFSLKRDKQGTRLNERIAKVLGYLGFEVESVEPSRNSRNEAGPRRIARYKATVQTVANRNQCPVPQFGSAAYGRYQVLCIWDRRGEEDIVNVIGDERQGSPVLVFHFGTVTEARRRTIARLAKQRKQLPFIVVDDAAILFLCGERGARMPILFDIVLPFAAVEPYTITASQVPAEMFYGRDQERRALRDPHGSSFVYGGRQLGKTALLRAVEAEGHDPKHGHIAVWVDLKNENIGISRKSTDLWTVVAKVLKNAGALPENLPLSSSPSRIEEAIKGYLSEDPERRILLLLDEADKFLESDTADNFALTSRLKGLMDATDRRFKVVLAGLHNVQRVTRHVNQPLAHYGDPICVGPLLQNGEVRAARELIRRPFAALGYRFESDDLITRILGQTNYYPSLIQLYCMHLLRHLMEVPFSSKTTPPYVITSEHLDEVYRSQELHKAIRSRFQLTLDLDQRYEVLALTIAHRCLDDPQGLLDGYATQTIRDQALEWWAEGFESDSSLSAFEALLDEMIGLGVLRSTGARTFTLRNRNVMDLMGSRDDIETRLLQDREPPAEFEPSTFRSQIGRPGSSWLSPLTAQQESVLVPRKHGVSFVFGTRAADIDALADAFTGYDSALRVVKEASDARSFERELDSIAGGRKGGTVVLVDPMCPWGDEWVAAASGKIQGLRSKDRFVRVVFAGTADTLRGLQRTSSRILSAESEPPVSLGPWGDPAVRTWLAGRGYPNLTPDERNRLKQVTGYWPGLLRRFARMSDADPANWQTHLGQLAEELEDAEVVNAVLQEFSLDHQEVITLLAVLDGYGDSTADDIVTLHEHTVPLHYVTAELQIGVSLRYVQPAGHGTYRVDPVVGRLARIARS